MNEVSLAHQEEVFGVKVSFDIVFDYYDLLLKVTLENNTKKDLAYLSQQNPYYHLQFIDQQTGKLAIPYTKKSGHIQQSDRGVMRSPRYNLVKPGKATSFEISLSEFFDFKQINNTKVTFVGVLKVSHSSLVLKSEIPINLDLDLEQYAELLKLGPWPRIHQKGALYYDCLNGLFRIPKSIEPVFGMNGYGTYEKRSEYINKLGTSLNGKECQALYRFIYTKNGGEKPHSADQVKLRKQVLLLLEKQKFLPLDYYDFLRAVLRPNITDLDKKTGSMLTLHLYEQLDKGILDKGLIISFLSKSQPEYITVRKNVFNLVRLAEQEKGKNRELLRLKFLGLAQKQVMTTGKEAMQHINVFRNLWGIEASVILGGKEILPLIEKILQGSYHSASFRQKIIKIIGRVGGQKELKWLQKLVLSESLKKHANLAILQIKKRLPEVSTKNK